MRGQTARSLSVSRLPNRRDIACNITLSMNALRSLRHAWVPSTDQPFLCGHQCHPADRAWRVLAESLPIYTPSHCKGAPDGGTKKYGPFRHESPWVYVRYGVAKGSAVELAWQVSPLDGFSDRADVGPVT